TAISRATERFTLDSHRQIELFQRATHQLNGQLIKSSAVELLHLLRSTGGELEFPRDITLEINTVRLTRPIYSPLRSAGRVRSANLGSRSEPYQSIQRPDMPMDVAVQIFSQLSRSDNVRLTFAGVGDPLLHPQFFDLLRAASDS